MRVEMTHFAEGLGFDLADALAGDAKLFADFLEGPGIAVAEAEAEFEDFAFAFGQIWPARRPICP